MARAAHPKKDIEMALCYAEWQGWRVEIGAGHAWGQICCPYNSEVCGCGEFCITSVWRTPKNPTWHARALCRVIDNCTVNQLRGAKASIARQE